MHKITENLFIYFARATAVENFKLFLNMISKVFGSSAKRFVSPFSFWASSSKSFTLPEKHTGLSRNPWETPYSTLAFVK